MIGVKALFRPRTFIEVEAAVFFIWGVFIGTLAIGAAYELFFGTRGAIAASGGISIAVCVFIAAFQYRSVFDGHLQYRIEHSSYTTAKPLISLISDQPGSSQEMLEEHLKHLDQLTEERWKGIEGSNILLRMLFVTDVLIVAIGTVVWAIGDLVLSSVFYQ